MLSLKRQSGFTLMEMMVTIAVIGIMAAIAVPNYLSYLPKSRLNGAARVLVGDLMDARMKAVKENNEYRIFFLNDKEYKILDDNNNDGVADTGEPSTTKNIQNEYPDVIIVSATGNPIFSPRGTANAGATITLQNGSGCKRIKVHAFTGRVIIEECD